MSNRPVGSLLAKPKKGVEHPLSEDGKSFKIGALWAPPFEPSEHSIYNVSMGDRDIDMLDVMDLVASGDFYISAIVYDPED